MQQLISGAWKFAAVALALVPGIFGVVHWMVDAKTEAFNQRMSQAEKELEKGARFTAHDGEVLKRDITTHVDVHGREINQIREMLAKIRFTNATCQANVTSMNQRFMRLEDAVYARDGRTRHQYQSDIEPTGPLVPVPDIRPTNR